MTALTPAIVADQRGVLETAKSRGYPLVLNGLRDYSAAPGFIASFVSQHLFHSLYL
ncbi:MAG: hypothetical protein LPD71_01650 [Shewanella sp.]|nr:hypothetical protein [Shewanella sp.]MCF1431274.1 hypothetical protein [Shewanella sp.]MCF1437487.1 hypothetical protein [Shewanella sp.]MCF1459424.1 hypothetical protein [Shewanella sp.]